MSDCQKTVNRIRAIVRGGDAAATATVRELADEYQRLVVQVNNRLGRCGEFLKRSLRSEAIQLAEQEPNVLDQVATLDFPEIEEWLDVLEVKGIELPEELLFDTADELNEAYGVVGQLDLVLRQHRKLALQKAPLKKRIEILRQLEEMDLDTPFWSEDLAEFERARHAELAAEISHFAKQRNRDEVDHRVAELLGTGWSAEPASATVKTALKIQRKVRSFSGRSECLEIERRLRQAHSEFDLEQARSAREEWMAAVKDACLKNNDPLVEGIDPVLQWLKDQDQIEAAERKREKTVQRLRSGLESAGSTAELQQLAVEVRQDGEIPERLQEIYEDRLAELNTSEKNRQLGVIGGSIAVLLVSIIGTALLLRSMIRSDTAAEMATTIRTAIAAGDLSKARAVLDENAAFAGLEEYRGVIQELKKAETDEAKRAEAFVLQLNLAETSAGDVAAVKRYLSEAEQLARTETERGQVRLLERQVATALRESANKQKAAIAKAVDLVRKKLPVQQGFIDDPGRPIEQELGQLRRQLDDAKSDATLVPKSELAELTSLIDQIVTLQSQRKQILASRRIIRDMDENSRFDFSRSEARQKLAVYVKSLQGLAQHFANDPAGIQLNKTHDEEEKLWEGELQWHGLVSNGGVLPASDEVTKERLAGVKKWIDTNPRSPSFELAEQYVRVLGARQRQGSVTSGIIRELRTFLENRLLSDCWEIRVDDKLYYGPANIPQGQNKFDWYHDWDGRQTKSRPFTGSRPAVRRAPQVEAVENVRQNLVGITPDDWENRLLPIALSIQKDTSLDVFLRFYLLRRICMDAESGSEFLATEFTEFKPVFNTNEIVFSADWMDPEDQEAIDARGIIESKLFARLTDLEDRWRKAIEAKRHFMEKIAKSPQSIGWLELRGGGFWRCRTSYKPQQPTNIYTVSPTINQWQRIGVIAPSGAVELVKDPNQLAQGRLVFVEID